MKKIEIEITKETNQKQIQQSFEKQGWELESVRITNNKMIAKFTRKE